MKRSNRVKQSVIFGLCLTLCFGFLVGCNETSRRNTPMESPTSQTPIQQETNSESDVGIEEAKNVAAHHAGLEADVVTFTKEKLERDDGVAEYDIEFVTETTRYEYEIKASDGSILQSSQEPIEQIPQNISTQGLISVEKAKEAVLAHANVSADQTVLTQVELEYDDGSAQYEIKLFANGTEYSYTVNAATGSVIEVETESR